MSLTKEVMEKNKAEFLGLIESLKALRDAEGVDVAGIDLLEDFLCNSDFFYAPASSRFHGSYEGGLCEHSLHVYHTLKELVQLKGLPIGEDSIIICGLLHDFAKVNLYVKTAMNKKVYHDNGSKHDELGNFDWVTELGYKIDRDHKFVYGNHEETCEYMVGYYIPLKRDESVAILHHHGGMGYDSTKLDITEIYNHYPLACLLHSADLICTYIDQGACYAYPRDCSPAE